VITRRDLFSAINAVANVIAVGAIGTAASSGRGSAEDGPAFELLVPPVLGDRTFGKEDAPVTVIEYASMTCPHCAYFHGVTYPELKKRYIDAGKVRFVFREFPLDPLAAGASMLVRCADRDKFFPFVETLFQLQPQWMVDKPVPQLLSIAGHFGMNEQAVKACLSNKQMLAALVAEQMRASNKFGVSYTPTLFVNGKKQVNGESIDDLVKVIEPLLPKT
jgi:protein-disulfide isomerase